MNSVEAYPLHWPLSRPRTIAHQRKRSNFHRRVETGSSVVSSVKWTKKTGLTIADSRDRVLKELSMMGAKATIISSNLRLRQDGMPMSAQREPEDPGVAVYFQLNKQPHSLSCDRWDRAADNLAAIAKHVEAMRGQVRWGVADIATMFAGFKALPGSIITPAVMSVDDAAKFIANVVSPGESRAVSDITQNPDTYRSLYRAAAKKLHPDANAGQTLNGWNDLQRACAVLDGHHGSSC